MRCARDAAHFAVGLAILACWAAPSRAQAPRPPRTVVTNRPTFSLPVKIDDRDRGGLKELKFFSKAHQGPSQGEWVCRETASPTQTKFTFRASEDGEYWFSFVTVDKSGAMSPADLDKEMPGLVVIVDTKAPELEVRQVTASSGETMLRCVVRDANPDPATHKLEVMLVDRSWRPLEQVANSDGLFRVPAPEVLRGVVRASATDKAGNKAIREVDLGQQPSQLPLAVTRETPPPPIMTEPPAATPSATRVAATPVSRMPQPEAGPALLPPAPSGPQVANHSSAPALPQVGPPAVRPAPEPPTTAARILVNNLRCTLDYALEQGNVSKVEAYGTRDGGKSWIRIGEGRSPMPLALPEEGVYGVTLVVSTDRQPGAPPAAGDGPDMWLEADVSRPEVVVHGVQAGTGTEARVLTLSWSAQDRNLTPDSVEIQGAANVDGPWQPLVRGLKEKGFVQCAVPVELGGRVYLRVQATDKAGNSGRWETRDPVLLEGAKPKARVLGVSPSK